MSKTKTKKDTETVAKETVMETIQCICSNVHIGGGRKLTATKNNHGNWVDGDTAQVPRADAVFMESNGQVKIL